MDDSSLNGKRVLVTRPKRQAAELSARLRSLGAEPIEMPTIAVVPPDDWLPVDMAVNRIGTFDWLIFTSANGVEFFFERLLKAQTKNVYSKFPKIAAIGPTTARALERHGMQADYVPSVFLSDKIAEGLPDLKGQTVLLARSNIANKKLPNLLTKKGARVVEVAVYKTVLNKGAAERLSSIREAKLDFITFTSPSTVAAFLSLLPEKTHLQRILGSAQIVCIGPVTAQAAREMGLPVHAVANPHNAHGLVEALLSAGEN